MDRIIPCHMYSTAYLDISKRGDGHLISRKCTQSSPHTCSLGYHGGTSSPSPCVCILIQEARHCSFRQQAPRAHAGYTVQSQGCCPQIGQSWQGSRQIGWTSRRVQSRTQSKASGREWGGYQRRKRQYPWVFAGAWRRPWFSGHQ